MQQHGDQGGHQPRWPVQCSCTGAHSKGDLQTLSNFHQFLADKRDRACIIYAHGGGAIACSAETHSRFLAHMAMDCGIVVFNVDYRLAPETR